MHHVHAARHLVNPIDGVHTACLDPEHIDFKLEGGGSFVEENFQAASLGIVRELKRVVVVQEVLASVLQLLRYLAGALGEIHKAFFAAFHEMPRHAPRAGVFALQRLVVRDAAVHIFFHPIEGNVRGAAVQPRLFQQRGNALRRNLEIVARHLHFVVSHGLELGERGFHILFGLQKGTDGIHLRSNGKLCHGKILLWHYSQLRSRAI